jgi:hypothetical protein
MSDLKLDIAFWNYDITRPLLDGDIAIDGVDANITTARIVTEINEPMIREQKFDVAELGFTYLLRTLDLEERPFLGLPVFLARRFHYSAIFVNTHAEISTPKDLEGKRIGEFALYGHDSGFWPKGVLADRHGVDLSGCRWVIGGLDFPMRPVDYVPARTPEGVEVVHAEPGTDLGELLDSGEIDALISADVPKSVREGSPNVAPLFPDAVSREHDYYRETGIFPMIHTVVIRRAVAEAHPEVIAPVYKAFCESRDAAVSADDTARIFNHVRSLQPWTSILYDQNRELFGDSWWRHGIKDNREAIETVLRYHAEQGLTDREFGIEDVFVPELLDS